MEISGVMNYNVWYDPLIDINVGNELMYVSSDECDNDILDLDTLTFN